MEKPTTTADVWMSFGKSMLLFMSFIGFAQVLDSLKCGTICHYLLGSGR